MIIQPLAIRNYSLRQGLWRTQTSFKCLVLFLRRNHAPYATLCYSVLSITDGVEFNLDPINLYTLKKEYKKKLIKKRGIVKKKGEVILRSAQSP